MEREAREGFRRAGIVGSRSTVPSFLLEWEQTGGLFDGLAELVVALGISML